jgi:DEAD/DEAH box helicase domain-containing protein
VKNQRKRLLWERADTTIVTTEEEELSQNALWRRRHAADETARLLAIAVASGVRCIAFAKTRCLVEWIYDKCIHLLKQEDATSHLVNRIDSYRGGYTADVRRRIEEQLFQNKLLGVVGTSALELGVDIGGVDLTLHCGYPGSFTSLMQQAGRAGRGGNSRPSFSISICFNSPSEQYLWRNPKALLGRSDVTTSTISSSTISSIPMDAISVVQDHLLCAAAEFPLVGSHPVTCFFSHENSSSYERSQNDNLFMTDHSLFGFADIYEKGVKRLCEKGALCKNSVVPGILVDGIDTYSAHLVSFVFVYKCECIHNINSVALYSYYLRTHIYFQSIVKPWANVSIRSIEPLQYTIIDTSHPLQGGKMDGIHSEKAGKMFCSMKNTIGPLPFFFLHKGLLVIYIKKYWTLYHTLEYFITVFLAPSSCIEEKNIKCCL